MDATRSGSLLHVANRGIVCHAVDTLLKAGIADVAVLTPPSLAAQTERCLHEAGLVRVRVLAHDAELDPAPTLEAIADLAGGRTTVMLRADGLLDSPPQLRLDLLGKGMQALLLIAEQAQRPSQSSKRPPPYTSSQEQDDPHPAVAERSRIPTDEGIVCALAAGVLERLAHSRRTVSALRLAELTQALDGEEHGRVEVRPLQAWHACTGEADDLLHLNRLALRRIETVLTQEQRECNRLEGAVHIATSATVSSCVICGPAIIGAEAIVSDSYIGPYTSIGRRSRLEGAEIERSIVLEGASLLHLGQRLRASVVGRDAKVFRDFSLPSAMRLQICDADRIAFC